MVLIVDNRRVLGNSEQVVVVDNRGALGDSGHISNKVNLFPEEIGGSSWALPFSSTYLAIIASNLLMSSEDGEGKDNEHNSSKTKKLNSIEGPYRAMPLIGDATYEFSDAELVELIQAAIELGAVYEKIDSINASFDRWEKRIDERLRKLDSPR